MPDFLPMTHPTRLFRSLTSSAGAVGLAALLAVTGCYHGSARAVSSSEVGRGPDWLLVRDIKLIPQTAERECGAAALAMMLNHWSLPVTKDEIWKAVAVDPEHGIAAGALRDFAVKKGFHAFLIQGELADLKNEVGLNRPVLVGLIQRYGDRAFAHYEVVAGINPVAERVLLLDPAKGLREDSFAGFTAEWSAAGRPTLVIVAS